MSNATPRLPRYRRAAAEIPLLLTARDLDILAAVESHRLLTSYHLQALIDGSVQQILRRLQMLYHAGYLDRIRPRFVQGGGSARMVYAITNRGIRALQDRGLLESSSRTDWNVKNRNLHDLSIRHQLLVSHARAVVELACRRAGCQLLFWKEGAALIDRVEVALADGYARVPVAPDAFFALQDQKGRMNFFLEADRGTMTIGRFVRKLQAYAAYFRDGRHKDKFSIRYFRVLTVTTAPARASNLASAASRLDELQAISRMFLFSVESQLSLACPESVLSTVWTALSGQRVALVQNPFPNSETEVTK